MSACGSTSLKAKQPIKQVEEKQLMEDRTSADQPSVLVHGLRVDRYRELYQSVLQPSILAALSSAKPSDYVAQVLELKLRLWTVMSQPQLQETVGEDGRVYIKEILDLT